MGTQRSQPVGEALDGPIKKGLWERLFDSWWIPVFVVPLVVGLILNVLGIDSGFSLGAIPTLALMLILMWARNMQRRKRLELIAVRECSFECWLRHPNAIKDSLSHRLSSDHVAPWLYPIQTATQASCAMLRRWSAPREFVVLYIWSTRMESTRTPILDQGELDEEIKSWDRGEFYGHPITNDELTRYRLEWLSDVETARVRSNFA